MANSTCSTLLLRLPSAVLSPSKSNSTKEGKSGEVLARTIFVRDRTVPVWMRTKRHADVVSSWQPFGHQGRSALAGDQSSADAFRPRFRCVRLSGTAAPAGSSIGFGLGLVLAFISVPSSSTCVHDYTPVSGPTLRMTHRSCASWPPAQLNS